MAADVAWLLSGSVALFLWWFCLAYFDDAFRFGRLQVAVALLWLPLMLPDRGWMGEGLVGIGLSWGRRAKRQATGVVSERHSFAHSWHNRRLGTH